MANRTRSDSSYTQNPLQLPEILFCISRQLSQDDLTACIRVAHAWHRAMLPSLWRKISFTQETLSVPYKLPPSADLSENFHRVRSLKLRCQRLPEFHQNLVLGIGQDQLVKLSVGVYSLEVEHILANNTRSLRTFKCHSLQLELQPTHTPGQSSKQTPTSYLTILSNIVHLSSLSLRRATIRDEHQDLFFRLCGRLTSLSLTSTSMSSLRPPSQTPFPNMKRLKLVMNFVNVRDQVDFISLCPNLQHLTWGAGRGMSSRDLSPLLKTVGGTTRIVSLDFSGTCVTDEGLLNLLMALPNLKRLIATGSGLGEGCCDFITKCLQGRLEELDIRQCPTASSSAVQDILSSCKLLKRFKGDVLSARDLKRPDIAKFQWPRYKSPQCFGNNPPLLYAAYATLTQPSWKWACTSLEELELGLTGLEKTEHGKDSMKVIFDQLSELVQLKRLVLTCLRPYPKRNNRLRFQMTTSLPYSSSSPHDLLKKTSSSEASLDLGLNGGLDSLVTLQKLRILDLRKVHSLDLMAADVWWMCEHWTSLRSIRGTLTTRVEESAVIRSVVDNRFPHVKLDPTFGI